MRRGLKVNVIGVANPTQPGGLTRLDNPYGIELATAAAQCKPRSTGYGP